MEKTARKAIKKKVAVKKKKLTKSDVMLEQMKEMLKNAKASLLATRSRALSNSKANAAPIKSKSVGEDLKRLDLAIKLKKKYKLFKKGYC